VLSSEGIGETGMKQEVRNERALAVFNRVQSKLSGTFFFCRVNEVSLSNVLVYLLGRDFNPEEALNVHDQVMKLIEQATSYENLCQCFFGW